MAIDIHNQGKLYIASRLRLYGTLRDVYFDAAQALHWHCVNNHAGQWSELYRIQCELKYTPGRSENGPEADSMAADIAAEMQNWTASDCQHCLELIQETMKETE